MSDRFLDHLLENSEASLREMYAGQIYLLPANSASRAFASAARHLICDQIGKPSGDDSYRHHQFEVDADVFFEVMGRVRKQIYTDPLYHQHVERVIESLGFRSSDHAFDPARIRVISHNGHLNAAAAPIYYGHRDTWYANPPSMITWWIPLHDVNAEETFEFFPDEFARAVDNDSKVFDFDAWVSEGQAKRIGWQNKHTGTVSTYPRLLEQPQGRRQPVVAKAGDILLFSGQHLHQTRPNETGRTRFSLDFRTVHLLDHQSGIGAPNVDNASTGSSFTQFVRSTGESVSQ